MTDWPHSPVHQLESAGAYIVTAGTYRKQQFFNTPARLSLLRDQLLTLSLELGWRLQAWAVLANHYHFVALAPDDPNTLSLLIRRLHSLTARESNRLDAVEGRKIWFEYWDTHITYQKSYLERLNYVHQNPVRHGVVPVATSYPWCSAGWFERRADPAFFRTVSSFKIDQVNVRDDF